MNEFGEGWENFREVSESLPDLGRRTYIYVQCKKTRI